MYEFHYNDDIKNQYDHKSKLLFTDTECLMHEIKISDVHEDLTSDKKMFGSSHYATKSIHYDNSSQLLLEKWKMEPEALRLKNLLG